jgi:hypothetical protein
LKQLESNASALGVFWSPTLQLWVFFGIQRFSFGCFLESNASALGVFWSPTLQLWVFFGVQRFSFGKEKNLTFGENNALFIF